MATNRGYKRSWKNYLLDPGYQLRFTFTMLAVAAGLMAPLGWWVSQKATTATKVAINQINDIRCPEVLSATQSVVPGTPGSVVPGSDLEFEDLLDDTKPEPAPEEPIEPAPEEPGEPAPRERRVIEVNIDDSEMPELAPPVVVVGEIQQPPPSAEEIEKSKVANRACLKDVLARKESVEARRSLITLVMLISGFMLLLGLAVYGIKTTHRVAGPLFKVGLYLKKLENNIYDTVYNLRKGDQLVSFYEHFKDGHGGLVTMQEQDRDRLRDAITLAKEAGLTEKSDELATVVTELERLLAEKEESLVQKKS